VIAHHAVDLGGRQHVLPLPRPTLAKEICIRGRRPFAKAALSFLRSQSRERGVLDRRPKLLLSEIDQKMPRKRREGFSGSASMSS
jgi:hypothetical protein